MKKRSLQFVVTMALGLACPLPAPAQDHSAHYPALKEDRKPPAAPSQSPPAEGHSGIAMPAQNGELEKDHSGMAMPGMESNSQQAGHQMQMPQKSMEQLIQESPTNLILPIGQRLKAGGGPVFTLQQLEQMAMEKNPTLIQAAAEVRAARGRRTQAGLFLNPTVGYTGEEIRGGSFGGGQHGGFIEQTFILGGKLGLARKVAEQELRVAEIEVEEQRLRVQNSVQRGYYQVLAGQERLELHRSALRIAEETLKTAQRLRNVGMADPAEVLQSEIQLNRAQLGVMTQENQLRRQWKSLAALVGDLKLPQGRLEDRLDQDLPVVDEDQVVQSILDSSPAARIAEVNVNRSEALLAKARRQYVPDLSVRGGLQQNREMLGDTNRRVGLQGLLEVSTQLPIFNRNQGNVEASSAELERARADRIRIRLVLAERAAATVQAYKDARVTLEQYQGQILPKARQVYEMNLKAWGQMATSYPQVLMAQQNLFELQMEYVSALQTLRTASIALKGLLLTDGLEAPARPGEVDMPVRELNLPTSREMER